MTRNAATAVVMVGAFVVLLVVVSVGFIRLDPPGVRGTVIGAGLGLVNLLVGWLVTRHALRHGMKSAMTTLAGGFLARLFVVVVLILLFRRTGAADPTAFALTFLVFFFAYLGVEVVLVERTLDRTRRAA